MPAIAIVSGVVIAIRLKILIVFITHELLNFQKKNESYG